MMKKSFMLLMFVISMAMASHHALAQEVTITLNPGFTWFSYLGTEPQNFATVLGSFTPAVGDIILSQWGSATYMANGQWRGSISQFYPGYGYMYKSNRSIPVTLTMGEPLPQLSVTTAEPTDITTTSAVVGCIVTIDEGNHVFARGVCWGTEPNPDINGNHTSDGTEMGSCTDTLTELMSNTTYYVRSYMVTDYGLAYGEELNFTTESGDAPTGAINGLFSVSETQQVWFSQGNLQYQASTNTWRFADNQYDYIGSDNSNISSTYSGWIDLFGWGTSGYNHGANCYQPWSTSTGHSDYYAYGNYQYNLYDQTGQADWGYNPISNGGNQTNQWRTLTQPEWNYVFNTRTTTSGIRYAKANVNNVNGVILLPDDWSTSTYSLSSTNTYNASFSSNTLTASQWSTLEQAGAVFLPAAGYRNAASVNNVGSSGYYWPASYYNSYNAYGVYFDDSYLYPQNSYYRYYGFSVRLARVAE